MCKLIKLKEMTIIGMRVSCAFEEFQHEISKARRELLHRINEIENIKYPNIQFGIHKENPKDDFEDAYFVGYEVDSVKSIPKGMINLIVPAQTYGNVIYKGTNLHEDGYYKLSEWIKHNGYNIMQSNWTVEYLLTEAEWKEKLPYVEMEINIPIITE